jgi:N-acetylmuramoyl-L-alanine amidase
VDFQGGAMSRGIDKIVIHCSDTPESMDIGVADIRRWHTDQPPFGNGWDDIGYHYVIRRDGTVEAGRDEDVPGAHVVGYNAHSIGICLVGGRGDGGYTGDQWAHLYLLVNDLLTRYPAAAVLGHRDLDPRKACPQFDVSEWWRK